MYRSFFSRPRLGLYAPQEGHGVDPMKNERGKDNRKAGSYVGAGIAIGVAVGVAIDNIGAGIAIGVAIGAAMAARERTK
jgi:zinc transporter ZupT